MKWHFFESVHDITNTTGLVKQFFERRIVNIFFPISDLSIRVSSGRRYKCNCEQLITSLSLLVGTTVQYKQLEMFIIYH